MATYEQGTIRLDSPMIQAWRGGCSGYVPAHEGLAVEMSDPQTSLNNLVKLLEDNRRVSAMHVGPTGVLVVFSSGETYLATGFSLGDPEGRDHPVRYLAKFCSKVWGVGVQTWLDWLSALGEEYDGEIDPSQLPRGNGPTIFNGEDRGGDDS